MAVKYAPHKVPDLKLRDKVRVFVRHNGNKHTTECMGVVDAIYPYYIRVDTGKYMVTISIQDLLCGHATINVIKSLI